MATKEKLDILTVETPKEEKGPEYPMVTVTIPVLPGDDGSGFKVDQYEHVTIANEEREECWKVLRGEPVEVPVPVFIQLKQKYPKI